MLPRNLRSVPIGSWQPATDWRSATQQQTRQRHRARRPMRADVVRATQIQAERFERLAVAARVDPEAHDLALLHLRGDAQNVG